MDNVVYGLANYYGDNAISEEAKGSYEYIRQDIVDIKKRYISLGFHLNECNRRQYYKEFGFSCLAQFVMENFGIEKSGLSRIMSVFYKFADRDLSRVGGVTGYKMWVKDDYADYSYSQLVEMVSLNDREIERVTPKMTVKEIKEYKKSLKDKKSCDVATNEKVAEKVLTKGENCATPLLSDDVQRPFDERYQLTTGKDLFVEILDCLKNNIKNVDKVQAIIKLLNASGL